MKMFSWARIQILREKKQKRTSYRSNYTDEENPGKPQLGRGCATSYCLKWGSFPLNKVGRIAQHVRKEEGRKEVKNGQPPVFNIHDYSVFTFFLWLVRLLLFSNLWRSCFTEGIQAVPWNIEKERHTAKKKWRPPGALVGGKNKEMAGTFIWNRYRLSSAVSKTFSRHCRSSFSTVLILIRLSSFSFTIKYI